MKWNFPEMMLVIELQFMHKMVLLDLILQENKGGNSGKEREKSALRAEEGRDSCQTGFFDIFRTVLLLKMARKGYEILDWFLEMTGQFLNVNFYLRLYRCPVNRPGWYIIRAFKIDLALDFWLLS